MLLAGGLGRRGTAYDEAERNPIQTAPSARASTSKAPSSSSSSSEESKESASSSDRGEKKQKQNLA